MAKQSYKSIYFSDFPSENTNEKSITVAFGETESKLYQKIKDFSSQEIKELIGISSYNGLSKIAKEDERSINQCLKRLIKNNLPKIDIIEGSTSKDVTFIKSKTIPFQRWYPYIEGYAPDFVRALINKYEIKEGLVLEPFAGTGTTLFGCDSLGYKTAYCEVNPLLQFLIEVKMRILSSTVEERLELSKKLDSIAPVFFNKIAKFEVNEDLKKAYKDLIDKKPYFPTATLNQILKAKNYINHLYKKDPILADVLSIAIVACLLPVSYLKKQGDVRFRTPKELLDGIPTLKEILPNKLKEMSIDIADTSVRVSKKHKFLKGNAKEIAKVENIKASAIITSPPYLNGTNYFRNTKVELWFLGYITPTNKLRTYRDQVLTSGINDVKSSYRNYYEGFDITQKSILLKETIEELNKAAYDSRIPLMARSYFTEMYHLFKDCKKHLNRGAKVLIDIGDSIFCGVHIKTDEILIQLFIELGYEYVDHIILRKRRSRNGEVLTQSLIVLDKK